MTLRWDEKQLLDYQQRRKSKGKAPNLPPESISPLGERVSKGPNKTELAYRYRLEMEFPGCPIFFEGITFRMQNGHKYTPDFIVNIGEGNILCVEVKARGKDGYRQPSYQRAKLAFDQCRVEWNNYQYRWAEKHNGEWHVSDFNRQDKEHNQP